MSSSAPSLFLLSFTLVMIIVLGGCVDTGSPGRTVVSSERDQGIRIVQEAGPENANVSGLMSLDQALSRLDDEMKSEEGATQYSLHYIHGEKIDRSGAAAQWIFGVKTKPQNFFIAIRPEGGSFVPWRAWLPVSEIIPGQIIKPDALLKNNLAVLEKTYGQDFTAIDEIELSNGVYTLQSVAGNRSVVTRFDSIYGKVLD